MANTVDVSSLLDEGHWSGYQKLLIGATALAIVLDGVDNQLLSVAIPPLMKEWNVTRPMFTNVVAAGMIGMMLGGAIGGVLGDRLGRRVALLMSVFTFGVMTTLIMFADSLWMLGVLRFVAGFGLGGAMPNAAALASEYVPRRHRAFAVTLTTVCIPFGGFVAGLVGARILPLYGWRALFTVGGALPLVLGLVLIFALPESPRFLVSRRERWGDLRTLLNKLGYSVGADAVFIDSTERVQKASIGAVMTPEFRRDTLALCASFFFCLMAAYASVLWIPSMLAGVGFNPTQSSNGLAAWNLGGVVGALIGAGIITFVGSRTTMIGMCIGAVAGALAIRQITVSPELLTFALLAWTGGLINGVQTVMYALASNVYPAPIRSTGVGTAVAFGRAGSIISAYAGLTPGLSTLFALLAAMMATVAVALAAVKRHIPRNLSGGSPQAAKAA